MLIEDPHTCNFGLSNGFLRRGFLKIGLAYFHEVWFLYILLRGQFQTYIFFQSVEIIWAQHPPDTIAAHFFFITKLIIVLF